MNTILTYKQHVDKDAYCGRIFYSLQTKTKQQVHLLFHVLFCPMLASQLFLAITIYLEEQDCFTPF